MDKLLTIRDVASMFGVCLDTMTKLTKSGDCPPYIMVGDRKRFLSSSVREWITKKQTGDIKPKKRNKYSYKENIDEKAFLCVEDISKMLGICKRTVWRMRESRSMPAPVKSQRYFKSKRIIRWRRIDIERWIANGCKKTIKS